MLLTQGGTLLVEDALESDAGVAPQLGAAAGRLDQLPQLRAAQQTDQTSAPALPQYTLYYVATAAKMKCAECLRRTGCGPKDAPSSVLLQQKWQHTNQHLCDRVVL